MATPPIVAVATIVVNSVFRIKCEIKKTGSLSLQICSNW